MYETILNNYNYNFEKITFGQATSNKLQNFWFNFVQIAVDFQNNYQIDGQLQTIQVFSEQSKTISIQIFWLPEKRYNFKTIQFYNYLNNFEQVETIKLQMLKLWLSLGVSIGLDVISIEISISTPKKYQSRRSRKSRRFSKVSLDDREISVEIEISRFSLDELSQGLTF